MKSKDEILSQSSLPTEVVHVPEWGGDVWVATLSAMDGDKCTTEWTRRGKEQNFEACRALAVAWCVVDESGKRVFDPDTDVDKLNAQPNGVIQKLFDKACELNRFTKADQEALVKN